jgi:hypothetical protein
MTEPIAVEIKLDPNDIRAFLAALKRLEPKLATALRRNLRQAGDVAIGEMRSAIMELAATRDYGVRRAIAAGIKTQVMTSQRSNGVRISASGGSLGERRAMLKALNSTTFRHPLFGDRDHWYEQQGRPYFGAVLKRHQSQMLDAIMKALEEASKAVQAQ